MAGEVDIALTTCGLIALVLIFGVPLILSQVVLIGLHWRIEKLETQLAEAKKEKEEPEWSP